LPRAFETLPGRYYTDPDLFRRELETFFFNRWIWAGRTEMLPEPGDYLLREIALESIIVLRDDRHRLRAFYNVCRHRGTRICTENEGHFARRIQCPYHGWSYALDGALLGAPHMPPEFVRQNYPLHEIRVDSWDGHVFLNLAAGAATLHEQLGALPEKFAPWRMHELRFHKRISYDVHANWKLLVSNYNECLHCPLLHPALNRLTDYLGAANEPACDSYIGGAMGFCNGAETMSLDGKRRRAYLPGLGEIERKQVCYYAIYPNLLLSLHPDYMLLHTLWPKAVDRTEILCEWYFHPDELERADFYADDAIEFWDRTNREDWQIVEQSQLGIQSRAYTPGPYSPREELLHAFDQAVVRRERKN
jgi:Rieske 2Fe-2S family protein